LQALRDLPNGQILVIFHTEHLLLGGRQGGNHLGDRVADAGDEPCLRIAFAVRLGDHCLVNLLRVVQNGLLFVAAIQIDAVVARHSLDILQRRVRGGKQRKLAVDHQANVLRRVLRAVCARTKLGADGFDGRLDFTKQRVPVGALSLSQRGQQLL
jgi:hypothetical protein